MRHAIIALAVVSVLLALIGVWTDASLHVVVLLLAIPSIVSVILVLFLFLLVLLSMPEQPTP